MVRQVRARHPTAIPFTLNASSQLHVEVSRSEAFASHERLECDIWTTRAGLLANSSVCRGEVGHARANRELFYGLVVDAQEEPESVYHLRFIVLRQYIEYLFDFRGLLINRSGNYLALNSDKPFLSFVLGEYGTAQTPSGIPQSSGVP